VVGGSIATNVTRQVAPGEPIVVQAPPPPFVSRAGGKLDPALDRFGIAVAGRFALDAGSSTGGFTDCLLQRGATRVVAVDVGTNQLHERLRGDPRVEVRERTDIRAVRRADLDPRTDLVVADLSFISRRGLLAHLLELAGSYGEAVVLVKPQFEATRAEADRGAGVIRDPAIWRRVLLEVRGALDDAGATIMGGMCSPVRGRNGNVEFVLHLRGGAPDGADPAAIEAALGEAVALAGRAEGTT
jgi:23S rRNA (cytidine1920-2'-O)/16S rRNA (cytidine1409-2'-O)-methyltransferase